MTHKETKIIGIDPGSLICGYGIIKTATDHKSNDIIHIVSGAISVSAKKPIHIRLKEIYLSLVQIIRQYNPDEAVVEKVFFAKSARTALSLGLARGIALLAVTMEGLTVNEYSALEVKKAITGYGRAEKRQMQAMVKAILNLKFPVTPDSADALALALCHANSLKFKEAIQTRLIHRGEKKR